MYDRNPGHLSPIRKDEPVQDIAPHVMEFQEHLAMNYPIVKQAGVLEELRRGYIHRIKQAMESVREQQANLEVEQKQLAELLSRFDQ